MNPISESDLSFILVKLILLPSTVEGRSLSLCACALYNREGKLVDEIISALKNGIAVEECPSPPLYNSSTNDCPSTILNVVSGMT